MKTYLSYEELSENQKMQVKIWYYDDYLMNTKNRNISYMEMAKINDIVKDDDKDFKDYVSMISFIEEDFESEE